MNHRHLLPDEIDLLLDDEVGFGVAPLKAHIRDCADCRAKVDDARTVVDAVVFVPWHVAARDAVARWLPQSRPARVVVGAIATATASVLSLAILWVATQTDVLTIATGAAGDQFRGLLSAATSGLLSTMFGDQMFAVIQRT